MTISKFSDLEVWKEAHKLTILIYEITRKFPKDELFGLVNQLRRASVSIESCIAEGFSRFHYKDRLNFFYDSRGSIGEVQSQLIDAKDLGFINKDEYNKVYSQTEKVSIILGGLIRSTNNLVKK